MKISLTLDIEADLHSGMHRSLEQGLPRFFQIINKYDIKATLFVPALLLYQFPSYFRHLEKQGHEIALHGYEHERFDTLSVKEQERRIEDAVEIYKSIFKKQPKGFRAPQHSAAPELIAILKKNNFIYDASYTPFNILQLLFFPSRFKSWLKDFFRPRKIYKLRKNLFEIPTSSFLIPFVSLSLRIFPWPILKLYLILLKITQKNLVFYAHSWDFIRLPQSKIDTTFRYTKLLKNLEKIIDYLHKDNKNKFQTMGELVEYKK